MDIEISNEVERANIISKINTLKEMFKEFGTDSSKLSEEEKIKKEQVKQLLLGNEFALQEYRKNKGEIKPKKGDWIVTRNRYGYKRVKILNDDMCGWRL